MIGLSWADIELPKVAKELQDLKLFVATLLAFIGDYSQINHKAGCNRWGLSVAEMKTCSCHFFDRFHALITEVNKWNLASRDDSKPQKEVNMMTP